MTQSSLFTRLLCTGAVGLFGLTAFGSDQTTAAKNPGVMPSTSAVRRSVSDEGQSTQDGKIDPAVLAKRAAIAKGAIPAPPQGGGPAPRSVNDLCENALQINCGDTVFGDTTGDTANSAEWTCAFNITHDEWYTFVAGDTTATLSLCGSSFDTTVMVLDGCGGVALGCNDDSCGLQSQLTVNTNPGTTYWVAVGGYNGAAGAYTMTLTCGIPVCDAAHAQPGDIEENEPVCADEYDDFTNGGCNSIPPVFSPLNCGDSVHGTAGTFLHSTFQYRDTDWYEFDITGTGAFVTWTATANFPALIGILPEGCPTSGFLFAATGAACTEFSVVSGCLPAGHYYAFIAPSGFSGVPCGSEYRATLNCEACEPPPSCALAQPGDIEENEGGDCGIDFFNGGCNSVPPVYSPISCGDSVHGTSGTNSAIGYRDTDWWQFEVTEPGAFVTWTVIADFDFQAYILDNNCPPTVLAGTTSPACNELSVVSACLPPGQYVAFVSPTAFSGVTCGSQYRGTLTCESCEPPPPPANDDCNNAIAINCGDSVDGNNINATTDAGWTCAPGTNDVWYSFVAGSSTATVSLCSSASGMDTVLEVLDGCGGSVLGCNDDFCAGFGPSQVSLTGLVPGNTYLIAVGGYNGAMDTFTLTLSDCAPTGACCVNGNCSVITPDACAAAGGSYQGDGTDCGGVNYTGSTCGEALEDISTTGTLAATASNCDDCGESLALPFSFNFFGNSYSSVSVSSNGYLTFGTVLGDFSNDAIPNTATPNDIICPFWDDFNTATGGDIYYEARTSPSRFIVQWNRVIHYSGTTGENTFQAILYADGSIDLRQGTMDTTFGNTGSIGIENSDGTVGLAFGATPTDPGTSGACYHVAAEMTGNPCDQHCIGDLDNDGDRDIADLAILLSQFGSTGGTFAGDIDGDGDVDIGDLAALLSVYGVPC